MSFPAQLEQPLSSQTPRRKSIPYDDDFSSPPPSDREVRRRNAKKMDRKEQGGLRSLASFARKVLTTAEARELGPLSVAPSRPGRYMSSHGQLRTASLPTFGDIEFRFDVLRDLGSYAGQAGALAYKAGKFIKSKERVRELAGELHERIRETPFFSPEVDMPRLTGLGMSVGLDSGFNFHADVRMLCPDAAAGMHRVSGADPSSLVVRLVLALQDHRIRLGAARALNEVGAGGWIEEAALRGIDESVLTRSKAFELLSMSDRLSFSLRDKRGRRCEVFLSWDHGTISAHLVGDGWWAVHDTLCIRNHALPETVLRGAVGLPLGHLADVPVLPREAPIKLVENGPDALWITLGTRISPMTGCRIGVFTDRP